MKHVRIARVAIPLLLLAAALVPQQADAANCGGTTTGLVALPDLVNGTYQGLPGGLYPGTNEPPAAYRAGGLRAAGAIVARDAKGRPDPDGKVALLSIGMSNTTMEFSAFVKLAQADPARDTHVVIVDGAQGGQDAPAWDDPKAQVWSVVEDRLARGGVTDGQVGAIWLKQAIARPTSDFATYTKTLSDDVRQIVAIAASRYSNLQQVFLSPRTYGGYATTDLNPEPYAYWSGYADRMLILDSIAEPDQRPWIGWGAYLWTDGTRGRADGFTWTCDDVRANDGTHPSDAGQQKIATLLRTFFDGSPFASWYRGASGPVPSPVRSGGPVAGPTSPSPSAQPGLDPVLVAAADERERMVPWLVFGLVAAGVATAASALIAARKRRRP
ncbi:MAG TPA: hypothetical protein VIM50_04765 [Candidatus Limnocylindria bacterium]